MQGLLGQATIDTKSLYQRELSAYGGSQGLLGQDSKSGTMAIVDSVFFTIVRSVAAFHPSTVQSTVDALV